MLLATVNEPVTLSVLASDGRTDLYGQARLYDSAGFLSATVNLTHAAEGLYQAQHMPTLEGYFSIVYQLFFDAPRTIDAGYDHQGEALDVNSFRTNILKVLGLIHENTVVDLQTYDVDGNLTGARVRAYDSAANASAAAVSSPATYLPGLKFSWQVSAEFTTGLLSKYSILRVP